MKIVASTIVFNLVIAIALPQDLTPGYVAVGPTKPAYPDVEITSIAAPVLIKPTKVYSEFQSTTVAAMPAKSSNVYSKIRTTTVAPIPAKHTKIYPNNQPTTVTPMPANPTNGYSKNQPTTVAPIPAKPSKIYSEIQVATVAAVPVEPTKSYGGNAEPTSAPGISRSYGGDTPPKGEVLENPYGAVLPTGELPKLPYDRDVPTAGEFPEVRYGDVPPAAEPPSFPEHENPMKKKCKNKHHIAPAPLAPYTEVKPSPGSYEAPAPIEPVTTPCTELKAIPTEPSLITPEGYVTPVPAPAITAAYGNEYSPIVSSGSRFSMAALLSLALAF
jgi:hypothetical protein